MLQEELIQAVEVTTGNIHLKFNPTIKLSSISNDCFVVTKTSDDSEVVDPFQDIFVPDHYDSIARALILYWNDNVLEANTEYRLTISGLLDAASAAIDVQSVTFTVGDDPDPDQDELPPDPPQITIVDKSIKSGIFEAALVTSTTTSTAFGVSSVDPENGDYYLPSDYNNGRVTITFTDPITVDSLTSANFKVQRRILQRTPGRWESVSVNLSIDDDDSSIVYVDFPSTDATPVFNTADVDYFEENYKYRIIISKSILKDEATPSETMLLDEEVLFLGILDPLYANPDELTSIYPDATGAEIAEQMAIASGEVKAMLKLGDTETPPYNAIEYVKAAAACALSRVYDAAGGDELTFKLGDFSVTNRAFPRRSIDRTNATTWCELAGVFRRELLHTTTRMKPARKADIYPNPIPDRKLKRLNDES